MATKRWTGGGSTSGPHSGNWNVASNWSPSGVPTAGDDVVLGGSGISGDYTVTLNINTPRLDSLTINDSSFFGQATLAIGSFTLDVTGTGSGHTNAVSVSNGNHITIVGGTIKASALALTSSAARLQRAGASIMTRYIKRAAANQVVGGTR